jgi:hypothetical protein
MWGERESNLELRFVCGAVIKNITCHVRSRSKELEHQCNVRGGDSYAFIVLTCKIFNQWNMLGSFKQCPALYIKVTKNKEMEYMQVKNTSW